MYLVVLHMQDQPIVTRTTTKPLAYSGGWGRASQHGDSDMIGATLYVAWTHTNRDSYGAFTKVPSALYDKSILQHYT